MKIFPGEVDGGFELPDQFTLPSWTGAILGDFNADGKTDFIRLIKSEDSSHGYVYLSQYQVLSAPTLRTQQEGTP